ncbi:hypothetical protein [Rhizobium calliandrae]
MGSSGSGKSTLLSILGCAWTDQVVSVLRETSRRSA